MINMITIKSLIIIMKMMTIMQMIRTTIFQMILVGKMSLLINVCLGGWSGWPTCACACQLEGCPSLAWSRPHQVGTQTAFCSTSQLVVHTEALALHIMLMIVIVIIMMIVILSTSDGTSSQKLGRCASSRVRSVWKSLGWVTFGSKKFGPKILAYLQHTFGKYTFVKYIFGKYTFGKHTFGKYTFGKYPFGKYTFGK